jgi:hypothetical protein
MAPAVVQDMAATVLMELTAQGVDMTSMAIATKPYSFLSITDF